MGDLLMESFFKLRINLLYTNNKMTVLSSNIDNDIPVIRAHKIFKNCPVEIVNAIIGFYSESNKQDIYKRKIESYVETHFPDNKYKIIPPDDKFLELVKKSSLQTKKNNNDSSLFELEISSMTKRTFWGGSSNINPDEVIKAQNEDVTELEIIVDPF